MEEGSVIVVRDEQLKKAPIPRVLIVEGSVTETRDLHPKKTP